MCGSSRQLLRAFSFFGQNRFDLFIYLKLTHLLKNLKNIKLYILFYQYIYILIIVLMDLPSSFSDQEKIYLSRNFN